MPDKADEQVPAVFPELSHTRQGLPLRKMQARQPGDHDDESPGVDLLGGRAAAAPLGRAG